MAPMIPSIRIHLLPYSIYLRGTIILGTSAWGFRESTLRVREAKRVALGFRGLGFRGLGFRR